MKIRPARESDMGFLVGGYTDSYFDSYFAGSLPADLFKDAHKLAWKRVIARSNVLVVSDDNDEDLDIAFIVWQPDVDVRGERRKCLHYVYAKGMFWRRRGYAKQLLEAAGLLEEPSLLCSQMTRDGRAWLRGLGKVYQHNPLVMRYGFPPQEESGR